MPDETTVDTDPRAELEAKIAARMASLDGNPPPSDDPPAEDAPAPAEAAVAAPEAPAEEDPQPESPTDGAIEPDDGSFTLPDAMRRSLKSREWTDADIDELGRSNPELLLKTATKVHEGRVTEINEWAQRGRAIKEKEEAEAAAPPTLPTPAKLDLHALAEETGLDVSTLEEVLAPLAQQSEHINRILPQLEANLAAVQENREQLMAQQIDEFFQAAPMKRFTDFYGAAWDGGTEAQTKARNDVLNVADSLIVGAESMGQTLSVTDALDMAHHSVSRDFLEKVVRSEITETVKKRASGSQLRPSTASTTPTEPATPADARAALVAKVAARLSAL